MPRVPMLDQDASLVATSLLFDAPATGELREVFARSGKPVDDAADERGKVHDFGIVIEGARIHTLIGALPSGTAEATIFLRSTPKPKSDPPPEVLERQSQIGGTSGLAKVLAELMGATGPTIATYLAEFRLDARVWCGPVPRAPEPAIEAQVMRLGTAAVEQVGYRFSESVGGLQEVSVEFLHARPTYRIRVKARGPAKVDAALRLPVVIEACDLVLAHLFSRAEVENVPPQTG